MKKIITLLLAFTMCFAVSAGATDLDFMKTTASNYTAHLEMKMQLDKPLEILDILEEQGFFEDIDTFIDVKLALESMFEANTVADMQADISEDFKKIRMSMTMEQENGSKLNKNLEISGITRYGMWLDMDFSDMEKPKLDFICTYPYLNKYMYLTYDEIVGDNQEVSMLISLFFESGLIEQIQENSYKILSECADIKIRNGKCTIKLTDEGLDKYIVYILELMSNFGMMDMDAEAAKNELAKIRIIDEKGIVETATFNARTNKMSKADAVIPFDINIYDIMNVYSPESIPQWLTRENSSIKFSVTETVVYTNVGSTKNIVFPVLTEDNSVSVADFLGWNEPEPDYGEYEQPANQFYSWAYIYTDTYIYEHGTHYVPFRALIDDASYDEGQYIIGYDNGKITFTSPCVDFENLTFEIGGAYYCDGAQVNLAPAMEINGTTWVDIRLFTDVFGWELDGLSWDYIYNELYVSFYTGY